MGGGGAGGWERPQKALRPPASVPILNAGGRAVGASDGVSRPRPAGRLRPRTALSAAPQKVVNLLQTVYLLISFHYCECIECVAQRSQKAGPPTAPPSASRQLEGGVELYVVTRALLVVVSPLGTGRSLVGRDDLCARAIKHV